TEISWRSFSFFAYGKAPPRIFLLCPKLPSPIREDSNCCIAYLLVVNAANCQRAINISFLFLHKK
ncbi:hypothetical protein, partial [Desulfonauticus submarinus]